MLLSNNGGILRRKRARNASRIATRPRGIMSIGDTFKSVSNMRC